MEVLLLFAIASKLGPAALLVEAALALWRPTRYFAIPLGIGIAAGLAAAAVTPSTPMPYFMVGFTALAVPIGLLCALLGTIDLFRRLGAASKGAREQPPA
jgi:hypothetical protein